MHRPARIGVPAWALRVALGSDLVEGAILASQRVVPTALSERGFEFENPSIQSIFSSAFSLTTDL
jgi:NAD dependent epimerase/dehydratase family enzyme